MTVRERGTDGGRDAVSRREFLRVGSLSVLGLSVAEQAALAEQRRVSDWRSCIFLLMTGGASQLETFDPKPEAPADFRGPLRAISTAVPGVFLSESLPRLAERMGQFALLRGLTHDAAPIHETGLQLLQTGRLSRRDMRPPGFGAVVARELGPRGAAPPSVVLPHLLGNTGVRAWQGQGAGCLGAQFEPMTGADDEQTAGESMAGISVQDEPEPIRRMYGETRFGRLCLQARRLVECGVRCVTVNLFDTLAHQPTWDCHGRAPWAPATLYDYRDMLGPQFDRAVAALLDDLAQRGLLDDTLVVAAGEFGRSPRVNEHGGRDHWPGVWSALVAGGGVQGGRVIGASDPHGAAPLDHPIQPCELIATIYRSLGLDLERPLLLGDGSELPLTDGRPVEELFA